VKKPTKKSAPRGYTPPRASSSFKIRRGRKRTKGRRDSSPPALVRFDGLWQTQTKKKKPSPACRFDGQKRTSCLSVDRRTRRSCRGFRFIIEQVGHVRSAPQPETLR